MNESLGQRLIPLLCVAAGVCCAVVIGRSVRQSESGPDLEVKAQFDQLPAAEQALIMGKAESLQRRWQADPAEYRRLKQLHEAVTSDEQLHSKLTEFHRWWLELDSSQKSRLKADGQFAANWPQLTENLYLETHEKTREISVRYIEITFTEESFHRFLDEVIPTPVPDDLAGTLQALAGDDQECERVLARSLWLFDHVRKPDFMQRPPKGPPGQEHGPPGDPPPDDHDDDPPKVTVEWDVVSAAGQEHLVPEEFRGRFRELLEWYSPAPLDLDDPRVRSRASLIVMTLARAAVHHYDKLFREKHLGDERARLASAYLGLDEVEQTDLLKLDPDEVQQYLRRRLIEEQSVEDKDPALAQLAEMLNRFTKKYPYSRPGGFGRGRRDRSSGGGQGGGFRGGRGRDGERGPNDGRRLNGERGPGEGRGPKGGRENDGRGPGPPQDGFEGPRS